LAAFLHDDQAHGDDLTANDPDDDAGGPT